MLTRVKRLDIQGLRALAVIGVVLFHLNPAFLTGGFLGVDVFFVISGFVIGHILLEEFRENGRIEFSTFIAKRLFRLLPALAVTTLVVVLVSHLFFTSPLLHETVNQTALSGVFGISNFVIAYISGGYFGEAPDLNPLVHTWSLSAEWQFYLLVPLIFLAIGRLRLPQRVRNGAIGICFIAVGIASFFFNFIEIPEIAQGRVDLNGYYSSIGRFWEFAAGVLAALVGGKVKLSRFSSNVISAIGLVAIVCSFLLFEGSMQTPGRSTLVPVAGTVLLIFGGFHPGALLTRAISIRPMTWIGDLSYSIYLWHWPLIFFAGALQVLGSFSGKAAVVLATLAVSWASYHFLEKKVKYVPSKFQRRNLTAISAMFALTLVAVVGWHYGSSSYQNFLLKNQLVETIPGDIGPDGFHRVLSERFVECVDGKIRESSLSWGNYLRCQQTSGDAPVEIALVGDSHAEHLFYGLVLAKPGTEIAHYIQGELPIPQSSEEMTEIIEHVANSRSIEIVVVSAFWLDQGIPESEITAVVEMFISNGKSVYLTNDVPHFPGIDPAACKASVAINIPRSCDFEPHGAPEISANNDTLRAITSATGATFVDTYGLLCQAKKCSMSGHLSDQVPEALLYRDANHLNLLGSVVVGRELARHMNSSDR
jgi:peptidoglycan/LPS O-acetylase OafA/YrhL